MGEFIDRTGHTFGRLTVVRRVENNGFRQVQWLCRCICSKEVVVSVDNLRTGNTRSCGCLNRDNLTRKNQPWKVTHGMTHTSEYHAWQSMRQRCFTKHHAMYKYYGGRGITVCERWRDSFEAFYADMGPKPTPHHSLDRIDNYGNYEPSNCRWATRKQQMNNQRRHRTSE